MSEKSSGVIPYRLRENGELEVLLITSTKSGRWGLPKGHIEPHLTPLESAIQEAYEEAGVCGKGEDRSLGTYVRRNRTVVVFPMLVTEVLKDYPEGKLRKRKWFRLPEAAEHVDELPLKGMILDLPRSLKNLPHFS